MQSEDRKALIAYLQAPLQAQRSSERHKFGYVDTSPYTIHDIKERQRQSWLGQSETIPSVEPDARMETTDEATFLFPDHDHWLKNLLIASFLNGRGMGKFLEHKLA